MKAKMYDLEGKESEIELPEVFETKFRPGVIKRAFLFENSIKRQKYGSNKLAGKRSSAHYHGLRSYRFTMMNKEMARMPRLHDAGYMSWRARIAPHTVKGRKAHPPKSEKNWELKINKKELILALKSAISSTKEKILVKTRGHIFEKETPIILIDDAEKIEKTKDFNLILKKIGLEKELVRSKKKKIRAGKGKARNRPYKRKKGPLVVVSGNCNLLKSSKNIPGIDVCSYDKLNVNLLAPGGEAGRLAIFTESSLKKIQEKYGE